MARYDSNMSGDYRQLLTTMMCAGLVLAGCSDTYKGGPCAMATFALHALNDSTVTWRIGQSPAQTSIAFVSGTPSAGQCIFAYQGVVYESGMKVAIPGTRVFACVGEGQQRIDYFGPDLGDPRAWSVGTFNITSKDGGVECHSCGSASSLAGNSCLYGTLDRVTAKVEVETAMGGEAPLPRLVTDDFVRTFRVEFDTSGAEARTPLGQVCDFPATEKASLHLTQTAADYVFDADAPCPL